jgi:hypothetical protein
MSSSAWPSGREPLAPPLGWRLITYLLIFMAWMAYAPKVVPYRASDRGIFVSVAERLLAGDTLYRDVLDNKEPLFYYFVAVQRIVGGYGEFFGELIVLAIASYSVYKLSLMACRKPIALVVGWIMAPFILTGQHYIPGYTELPGTALVLLLICNAYAERWFIAGALAAILFFAKLPFFPLGVVSLACLTLRNLHTLGLRYTLAGFFLAFASIASLLAVRGEWISFLDIVRDNFFYANNSLLIPSDTLAGLSYFHLSEVMDRGGVSSYVLMLIISIAGISARINNSPILRSFSWLTIVLVAASLMILAFTGLWDHHIQIAFIPASIALIVFVGLLEQRLQSRAEIITVGLSAIVAFVLAGAPIRSNYLWNVQNFRSNIAALDLLPLEAKYIRATGPPTTYARLGQNNDGAHAIGLRDWKLACRKFDQYEFDDIKLLQEVEQCIPTADILIVSSSFVKYPEYYKVWNSFVDRMNEIVARQFDCNVIDEVRICKNRLLSHH